MIVENSQRFSAQLIRSYLFTRAVEGLSITYVVRQIIEHCGGVEHLASMPILIGIGRSGGVPVEHLRLVLMRRPC